MGAHRVIVSGRHDRRIRTSYESVHSTNGPQRRLQLPKSLLDIRQRTALHFFINIGDPRHHHGCVYAEKQLRRCLSRLPGLPTERIFEQLSVGSTLVHTERSDLSRC